MLKKCFAVFACLCTLLFVANAITTHMAIAANAPMANVGTTHSAPFEAALSQADMNLQTAANQDGRIVRVNLTNIQNARGSFRSAGHYAFTVLRYKAIDTADNVLALHKANSDSTANQNFPNPFNLTQPDSSGATIAAATDADGLFLGTSNKAPNIRVAYVLLCHQTDAMNNAA